MSYYPWDSAHEPVQPITPAPGSTVSGLGAYYAWNSSHEPVLPINGLGSESGESKLSDEAMRSLIDGRAPLAVVGEWAIQQTDGVWKDTPKESALTLIRLSDSDLNRARRAAFGAEAQAIGVFTRTPKSLADQSLAFAGTPYEANFSLAVYRLTDGGRVALPYFLTIATLRDIDDEDRGKGSVERAAAMLGGMLVYIISLEKPAGARTPGAPFQAVFNEIARRRAVGDAAPVGPTSAPATQAAASGLSLMPYFLGGVVVAGGTWLAVRKFL